MVAVKKELEDAKAQIITLQQEVANAPTKTEATVDNSDIEELKVEMGLTKSKLDESEAQVSKLSQTLRSQQMLNHQLEERIHGQERLNAEVLELQKKLNTATKSLESVSKKR